ncbi:MAG: hypothetical protein K0B15_12140 [Lentimicrobium sp.]|nr:hypothetical protein [Lentimicrobium sp.]
MNKYLILLLIWTTNLLTASAQNSDTILFSGQASIWANYNFDQELPVRAGARYIPQANYRLVKGNKLFDAELSLNLNGSAALHPFDSITGEANLKPYRAWIRYSGLQFEIRAGLQKINFGSAAMLRPLMWFDKLDPRDPLQLTDGVWGILGRYYFLNNANLWLWVILPSEKPKTWEFVGSNTKYPESGGRIQLPVPKGEMAFTAHRRMADMRDNLLSLPDYAEVPETRLGLDGKWDLGIGLWFEASQISFSRSVKNLTHQTMINIGADYTFGIGNGLNVIVEHLQAATGEKLFSFSGSLGFTGLSINYPLSMKDNLGAITYLDLKNKNSYNFLSYKRQLRKLDLHIMAFLNPEIYQMPYQTSDNLMFSGKGIQLMMVYNH